LCVKIKKENIQITESVVVVIVWWLNLQLPIRSLHITTNVVSSNPTQAMFNYSFVIESGGFDENYSFSYSNLCPRRNFGTMCFQMWWPLWQQSREVKSTAQLQAREQFTLILDSFGTKSTCDIFQYQINFQCQFMIYFSIKSDTHYSISLCYTCNIVQLNSFDIKFDSKHFFSSI
jgi:hypothetical protein